MIDRTNGSSAMICFAISINERLNAVRLRNKIDCTTCFNR